MIKKKGAIITTCKTNKIERRAEYGSKESGIWKW